MHVSIIEEEEVRVGNNMLVHKKRDINVLCTYTNKHKKYISNKIPYLPVDGSIATGRLTPLFDLPISNGILFVLYLSKGN